MEFFPDGLEIRLRSRIRGGLYLYARDDGLGVAVSPAGSSPNTRWEVRRFRMGTDCFVLCSSATGRCLAVAESPAHQRAAAVQRDHVEGQGLQFQRATWRATWAGLRHGYVILFLHDIIFFRRKLCVEAEARCGNGVFVDHQLERRGKNRTASASRSNWLVEAALPLSSLRPAPDPAQYFLLSVPRLNLDTAASARLPILGSANEFLGYLPARCISGDGLLQLLHGSTGGGGEMMLHADAAEVGGNARNGEQVTALAFVAERGKGITTLPLHLGNGPALDGGEPSASAKDDIEPEPASVVVDGADDMVQEEGEELHAEAALEEQAHQQQGLQANADAVGRQEEAQVDEDDQQDAGEHHNANAQMIDDILSLLDETYEVMMKKHRNISRLVEERRVAAEEAAARRDWSQVAKEQRSLQNRIAQDIDMYNAKDQEAAGFRDSLVRLGIRRPPSPPPLLRRHPEHLLTRRRG